MKIKTSNLTGAALDWAVARCEGATNLRYDTVATWWVDLNDEPRALSSGWSPRQSWHPSTNWAQGGPIIEHMRGIKLKIGRKPGAPCYAHIVGHNGVERWHQTGKTPLISAMRCYAASKLGDTVEIPDELC